MGIEYRKRIKVGNQTINLSKSGVSVTKKFGPFTVNSRGHVHLRLGPGLTWRIF